MLKKNGVVDAGAAGFVDLLRGVHEFARSGSLKQLPEAVLAPRDEQDQLTGGHDGEITHRYCTECMVTGAEIDRRKLRERLAAIGSNLVLAGSKTRAKVHDPRRRAGRGVPHLRRVRRVVSGEKADDMLQQARESREGGGVAVVCDSAADIPDSEMERLNIHMVPVRVAFGEHGYLDKIAFTAEEFYEQLRTNPHHPKTSQPAPGDFRRQFQFLGSHYDAVVSVNLSAKVSGTWQAAVSAAARADGAAVTVVDSLNVSCGQGLLVMYAAECAKAGMDAERVAREVIAMRSRTRTWGMLRDLTYGVRGGRVSKGKEVVADLLRVTPILTAKPDGSVKPGGVILGRSDLVDRFARFVTARLDGSRPWRILVGHCNAPDDGARLHARLRELTPGCVGSWYGGRGPRARRARRSGRAGGRGAGL